MGFVFLLIMNETIIHQASMSSFIRTILIIVAIYYIFKFLARLFAPYLMKKVIQKAQGNFQQRYEQQFNGDQQHTTTKTDKSAAKQPLRSTKKVGEYIDYEELE